MIPKRASVFGIMLKKLDSPALGRGEPRRIGEFVEGRDLPTLIVKM